MSEPQFTIYSSKGNPPNGWKVKMIMAELGLTYKTIYLDLGKKETKSPEHVALNPNGRIPTIIDHGNNDFVLWESGAIVQYLLEKYDTNRKISFSNFEEKALLEQWLYFQASGQGPYFGQLGWFSFSHPEKIQSVKDRYKDEILRVFGVLESVLSKKEWLVGGKCSAADISFYTWNWIALKRLFPINHPTFDLEKEYPAVYRWHNAILARPAVKKVYDEWQSTMSN